MVKNLLNYDNLIKHLRKKGYKEIREGEFIVNEDEEFEIADVLVIRKGQNYKEDLSKLKKEIEESASLVEGERKEYGILFVDNYVIFLRRVTDGLRSKVVPLRKSLDKISPAFEKKFKKLLKDIGNWQYWDELFDRSDIIEEFYKLYIKARENLLEKIKGIADDKKNEEFADDLLMQLLIIWYLQEKGFLNNDPRYLVTKFKEYKDLGFGSYYKFLRELFKAMMSEPNDGIYYKDDKFGKIVVTGPAPFLNGDFEDVDIPDEVFYVEDKTDLLKKVDPKKVKPSDVPILNLFESRDWTEGNIDEFVLGAIFEKLMTAEDRKEKGAYYTPEPITEYICSNTIEPYLVDRINEKFGTKYESLDEFFEKDTNEERYAFLFNEMQNIKILDPACGSGHFLETAINVLVEIYEKIWERSRELGFSYENFVILTVNEKGKLIEEPLLTIDDENERILKLKFYIIISRNIYGVDILPSAIKVAKARLFLSLAKHFDTRKGVHVRFPNVHFNLRVGNSLIGFTDLNAFERFEGQVTLERFFADDGKPLNIELDKGFEDYIKKMDETIGTNTYALLTEVRNHFSQKLTQNRLRKVLRLRSDLISILLVSLNTDYAIKLKKLIDGITNRLNERLSGEYVKYLKRVSVRIDIDYLSEKIGYFHWIMEFSEVFLEKGGFDVVLGNPPYGDVLSGLEKEIINKLKLFKIIFSDKKYKGTRNIATLFIERSYQILREQGYFGMIVPKSLLYVEEWGKVREFLLNDVDLKRIVDNSKAFSDVKLEMCTIIYKKATLKSDYVIVHNLYLGRLSKYSTSPHKIPKRLLSVRRFITELDETKLNVYFTILSKSVNLGEIAENYRGLNLNRYVEESRSKDSIPVIRGRDIKRFGIKGFGHTKKEYLQNITFTPGDIIAQRIVAHIENPTPHIELMATLSPPINIPNVNTVTNFKLKQRALELRITPKYLVAVLNSEIVSWFVYKYVYVNAIRSMDFVGKYADETPILIPRSDTLIKIVELLTDYILFLETLDEKSVELSNLKKFFKSLLNCIFYTEYLNNLLQTREVPRVIEIVKDTLKPINYDEYSALYWKAIINDQHDSTSEKLKELRDKNLRTIINVYERLSANKQVRETMLKIGKSLVGLGISSELTSLPALKGEGSSPQGV